MTITSKIQYWRNSLADSAWVTPELYTLKEINRSEIFEGRLCPTITATLFAEAQRISSGPAQQRLQIALYPFLVTPVIEHGVMRQSPWSALPLIIPALLDKAGRLSPCTDEGVIPHILRSCLEPNSKDSYVVGTIEAADQYQEQYSEKLSSWADVLAYASGLFGAVTNHPLADFAPVGVAVTEKARVGLFQPPIAAMSIIGLYDALLKETEIPSLLKNAITRRLDQQPPSLARQIKFALEHVGQMNFAYGLSPSQRESLYEFLAGAEDPGRVDAINGPPGTGKTTLLQSVVATLWVQAAVKAEEPPLIVAASTNNQAVTNIIDSFGAIDLADEFPEELKPLCGRWLPRINSYGVYFPSGAKSDVAVKNGYQIFSGNFKDGGERFFLSHLETQEGFLIATNHFLDKIRLAFPEKKIGDVQAATTLIHAELKTVVGHIQDACREYCEAWEIVGEKEGSLTNNIRTETEKVSGQIETTREEARVLGNKAEKLSAVSKSWEEHLQSEPLWLGLFSFLPPIRARRESRDRLFFMNNDFYAQVKTRDDVLGVFADHENLLSQQTKSANFFLKMKERTAQLLNKHFALIQSLCANYGVEDSWDDLQAAIDTKLRHKAFLLATHYWEARYLQDVDIKVKEESGKYDNRAPMKLMRAYYRMAKVAPCFISTFHSLPRMFVGFNGDPVHLWEAADLLIVDEAGQVSPEIGMSGFTLAKRALLVGDTAQIEPVWNMPLKIDRANARSLGVIEAGNNEEQQWNDFMDSGQNVSSGSLMRVAQQSTPLVKYANIAPGLFLTEHRRCQPEIISYCNELVYHGHLSPCRASSPALYPKMGYAHIPGQTETTPAGSRFNRLEAQSIAEWLVKEKDRIEEVYGPIEKAIGIVTPFTAQANVVRKALANLMPKEKITIGTVHSFQGGERPIMMFSPTYGMGHNGRMFFAEDTRMLNVAVSRAKDSFLVFGNMELFHSGAPQPVSLLGKFLFQDPASQEIQGVFSREALIAQPSFPKTKTEIVDTLEGHRWLLKETFDSAREYLMVVSPFISHKAIKADEIVRLTLDARNRGVDVTFVCDLGFNMDQARGEMNPIAQEGLRLLTSAGCKVRITCEKFGLHSKLLLTRNLFVSGSFNWLSARRDDSKANHELSQVLRGELADQEALKQFKGMMERTVEVEKIF